VFDESPIVSVELIAGGLASGRTLLKTYGLPSPDVQAALGAGAASARFDEVITLDPGQFSVAAARLSVLYRNGERATIHHLGGTINQPAGMMQANFMAMLDERSGGSLLEVGSRARSAVTRRDFVPESWSYQGIDIIAGPNVDVVGDAHELSSIFPQQRFDAVMAFSVLEHLLMPWKFIIELNQVLNDGAIGIFTTHQCWPLHDQPWDFWRFSDRAWAGLLNHETGFQIIEANMGEPAFVVAQRCHPVTNFGLQQGGFLASNVLFRKIGPTRLSWPVKLSDIVQTDYPKGELAEPPA
jgi:hypothetical protein